MNPGSNLALAPNHQGTVTNKSNCQMRDTENMCFENNAEQVIFSYIRKCEHSLFSKQKNKLNTFTKATQRSTLTLLFERHADKILNSKKLTVNFGFTVNPCIQ